MIRPFKHIFVFGTPNTNGQYVKAHNRKCPPFSVCYFKVASLHWTQTLCTYTRAHTHAHIGDSLSIKMFYSCRISIQTNIRQRFDWTLEMCLVANIRSMFTYVWLWAQCFHEISIWKIVESWNMFACRKFKYIFISLYMYDNIRHNLSLVSLVGSELVFIVNFIW